MGPSDPPAVDAAPVRSGKGLSAAIYGLSAVVVATVVFLTSSPPRTPPDGLPLDRMPLFHATLNGTVALLLCTGYVAIRSGRSSAHRACMVGCFVLSSVFLTSYVTYHAFAPQSQYGGEGWIRPVYFAVLVTHIVLAALILPLALFTLARALRGDFVRHARLARWTLPIWLYVAVTGVLVYLMMAPYYAHQ